MNALSTLSQLFSVSSEDIGQALAEQARAEPALATAKNIGGFLASVGAEELNKTLDHDVFELLANGWTKLQSVREAAAKSVKTPGQPSIITLGQHDLAAPSYPKLVLYCDGAPLATLKFTLELNARFKSVALAITNGRLTSLAPGEASAVVRLKYKSVKLREQSTPAWKLPGQVSLGAGVPIPH